MLGEDRRPDCGNMGLPMILVCARLQRSEVRGGVPGAGAAAGPAARGAQGEGPGARRRPPDLQPRPGPLLRGEHTIPCCTTSSCHAEPRLLRITAVVCRGAGSRWRMHHVEPTQRIQAAGVRQALIRSIRTRRRRSSGGGSGRRGSRRRTAWRPTSRRWTPPMSRSGRSAPSASALSTSRMTPPVSWTSVRLPASSQRTSRRNSGLHRERDCRAGAEPCRAAAGQHSCSVTTHLAAVWALFSVINWLACPVGCRPAGAEAGGSAGGGPAPGGRPPVRCGPAQHAGGVLPPCCVLHLVSFGHRMTRPQTRLDTKACQVRVINGHCRQSCTDKETSVCKPVLPAVWLHSLETIDPGILRVSGISTVILGACCLQVLSYFREYHPAYVEWLDDSSCNILFRGGAAQLLRKLFLLLLATGMTVRCGW